MESLRVMTATSEVSEIDTTLSPYTVPVQYDVWSIIFIHVGLRTTVELRNESYVTGKVGHNYVYAIMQFI